MANQDIISQGPNVNAHRNARAYPYRDFASVHLFDPRGALWVGQRLPNERYAGRWGSAACTDIVLGVGYKARNQLAHQALLQATELNVPVHYIESFMTTDHGDDVSEPFRGLAHVYGAVTDEVPQPVAPERSFMCGSVDQLLRLASDSPNLYVPTFVKELEVSLRGLERLQAEGVIAPFQQ